MYNALLDVMNGGFSSTHKGSLPSDQYELLERVRIMIIEHEDAIGELTERAVEAERGLDDIKQAFCTIDDVRKELHAENERLREKLGFLRDERHDASMRKIASAQMAIASFSPEST